MELIIDANILFAVLIRSGVTAELAFEKDIHLIAPEFLVEEFLNHENEILGKMRCTREEFVKMIHTLNEVITVIPSDEYAGYITRALSIAPDQNDTAYFALALKRNCAIWSNDKMLKQQNKIKIYNTAELISLV